MTCWACNVSNVNITRLLGTDTPWSRDTYADDIAWLISLIYSSTSATKTARRGTNEGRWRYWSSELRFAPSFILIYAHKNAITAPLSISTPRLRRALFLMQSSNYQPIEQILWLCAGHFLGKWREPSHVKCKTSPWENVSDYGVVFHVDTIFGSWYWT